EPQPLALPRAEVDEHHVRVADQLLDGGQRLRVAQVHGERALPAVLVEVLARLTRDDLAVPPVGVALQRLHLDHIRAAVRQQLRAVRRRDVLPELDDAQAGEWSHDAYSDRFSPKSKVQGPKSDPAVGIRLWTTLWIPRRAARWRRGRRTPPGGAASPAPPRPPSARRAGPPPCGRRGDSPSGSQTAAAC